MAIFLYILHKNDNKTVYSLDSWQLIPQTFLSMHKQQYIFFLIIFKQMFWVLAASYPTNTLFYYHFCVVYTKRLPYLVQSRNDEIYDVIISLTFRLGLRGSRAFYRIKQYIVLVLPIMHNSFLAVLRKSSLSD
jgi:hypothetical protein